MKCYVDSSVVLRFLLKDDHMFEQTYRYEKIGSSELMLIECSRVLQRYRLENLINDEQFAELKEDLDDISLGLYILDLTESVKTRAKETFPTVIGTLDALHLASALLWEEADAEENLGLLTVDNQMATCARAMGTLLIS